MLTKKLASMLALVITLAAVSIIVSGCEINNGGNDRPGVYPQPVYPQPYPQPYPPHRINPHRPIPYRPAPYCPPGRPCPRYSTELVDIPEEWRQPNWTNASGSGSCAWASLTSALRAQNQAELAAYVESRFSGGATGQSLMQGCDSMNIPYVATSDGDPGILEWANSTQRAGVIFFYPKHAVTFCGFVDNTDGKRFAVLLDNNKTSEYRYEPYDSFVSEWQTRYQGFALFPLFTPISPAPVR